MSSPDTLQRYHSTYNREQTWIESLKAATESSPELRQLDHFNTDDLWRSALSANSLAPRPSLAMLRSIFAHYIQNKEDRRKIAPFVSSKLLPAADIMPGERSFAGKYVHTSAQMCERSESTFVETLAQIRRKIPGSQPRVTVYHNNDGTPIALRKKLDSSNALTLEDITIDDFLVPAGTIVGIGSFAMHTTGTVTIDQCDYSAKEVDSPIAIQPLRISPWAYENPEDRELFAIMVNHFHGRPDKYVAYSEYRAGGVIPHTLDDFRAAAHSVMEFCEIEPAVEFVPMP